MAQELNPQDEKWYRHGYLAGYTIAFEDFKTCIKPEERLAFESWLQKELLP